MTRNGRSARKFARRKRFRHSEPQAPTPSVPAEVAEPEAVRPALRLVATRVPAHFARLTPALREGPELPVALWWACHPCHVWHPVRLGPFTTRRPPRPGAILARRAPQGCSLGAVDIVIQERPLARSWATFSPKTSFRISTSYPWPEGFGPEATTTQPAAPAVTFTHKEHAA